MLIKRLPWAEQPSDIVTPHERWLNLGLKSAYLLQPHLWTINLVTGRIGGTHVGTGVSFVGGKLRTPGTSGNGALLDHGVAINIAAPISMVVGCEHVSGSTDWGLLRNTANWYGWYSDATGAIKTANNNVFNGSLTLGGNGSVAFRHTSNADLTGSAGAGVSTDATTTLPTTVDRTQITLGYSRRSVSDAPAVADFTHFYVFNTALSDGALVELANEPHRLWEDRRIWVPVSLASSNVTITGTPGNAVAAGVAARVNQARAVTGTAGNASAAGVTAKINQARTVTGAVGNAVAAGVTAKVNRATAITGTTGNAVAAGVAATITTGGAATVTGTPGNAVAAGVQAGVNQARVITGTPGNATAAGVHATITTASGVTITGTPGNAVAAGVTATFTRNVAITAGPGNAAAAGVTATVSNGSATADGEGGGGRIRRNAKPTRKPKFLIEVDGKFVVVDSPEEARQVLSPKPVKKGKKAAKKADPEPSITAPIIDLGRVEDYADLIGEIEQFDAAMQSRHYQQILAMFDQMQDDEDVELLLLAL